MIENLLKRGPGQTVAFVPQPEATLLAEIMVAFAGQRQFECIWRHDMNDVWHRAIKLVMHALHAAKRRACYGRAVIGHFAGNDPILLRLALKRPVMAHEPKRGVIGF